MYNGVGPYPRLGEFHILKAGNREILTKVIASTHRRQRIESVKVHHTLGDEKVRYN